MSCSGAAQLWYADHDCEGLDVDVLATMVIAESDVRFRDLDADEIDRVCAARVATWQREQEVLREKHERAVSLEEERLAYLARRQADYRVVGPTSTDDERRTGGARGERAHFEPKPRRGSS